MTKGATSERPTGSIANSNEYFEPNAHMLSKRSLAVRFALSDLIVDKSE